jgi:hypothetical protein
MNFFLEEFFQSWMSFIHQMPSDGLLVVSVAGLVIQFVSLPYPAYFLPCGFMHEPPLLEFQIPLTEFQEV